MLFIVIAVILILLLGGGIWWAKSGQKNSDPEIVKSAELIGRGTIIGFIVGMVLLIIATSTHLLGTGQAALVYNFSGKLTGSRDHAGVFFTAPWESATKTNTQLQSETFVLCDSTQDSKNNTCSSSLGSAVTKDQQSISATLQINYHVDPKDIVNLYKTVGPTWKEKLVDSRVLQDFKEITSTFPTVNITQQRERLRVETRDRLRREFAPFSIDVSDFFIKNIGFSQSYNAAIEAKQTQVQAAARARAKVAQAQAEAQQAIAQAEGQARAIELKGKALENHPSVLTLEYIDKLAPNVKLIVPANSTLVTGIDATTAGTITAHTGK